MDAGQAGDWVDCCTSNILSWHMMPRSESTSGASFSKQLDIEAPSKTQPIRKVETGYNMRRMFSLPPHNQALSSLLKAIQNLNSQQEHLESILEKMAQVVARYQKMIGVAEYSSGTSHARYSNNPNKNG